MGFLAVLAAVVAGAALLTDTVGDTGLTLSPPGGVAEGEDDAADRGDGTAEGGDATVEALRDVLTDIDESERTMIAYQIAAFRAEGDPESSEPRPDEAVREDIAAAAETGIEELRAVRGELTGTLPDGADAARSVRNAYVTHLDAWIEHLEAVAADPDVERGEPSGGAYDDINATAEEFAAELEESLPADAPPEVRELARIILERGFSGDENGGPPTDAV